MYMCEDYNSPQSPYWCLKTLIAVALSKDDEFWTASETPYPEFQPPVALVPASRQIVCNHPDSNHHFMLSPAQFVAWPMKATQAKYSKFAYSSAFTFSVPTGPLIEQIVPDSTLALSRDGAETWALKWKLCEEATFFDVGVTTSSGKDLIPAGKVVWWPWGDRSTRVETTLIPPSTRWPDWHVRVHKITRNYNRSTTVSSLHTVEGGFAIDSRQRKDGKLLQSADQVPPDASLGMTENSITTKDSAILFSASGVSGVAILKLEAEERAAQTCSVLKPDSNTNLACQRTLIPVVETAIPGDVDNIVLATAVFAVSTEANGGRSLTGRPVKDRWLDRPCLKVFSDQQIDGDYIDVSKL